MEVPQGPMCQSCGMPLRTAEDHGTDQDGSTSADYCFHCFQGGRFLDEGISLRDKIEKNVRFGIRIGMTEEMARQMCNDILPKSKRWKKK